MKFILSTCLVALFLISGCVNDAMDDHRERPSKLPRSLTAGEETLISSGNNFSFNIFNRVSAAEEDKNVFISPLSISMALGMTLNGAESSTKAGIKETLGMSEMELQAINQSYQSLIELLVELDPKVEMSIGNSIWSRQGFPIQQSFKDTLATYFDARAAELDFSDPSAADVINSWVSEQTEGRVEEIIEGAIPPLTMLYLINAVYFKGDWLYQFDEGDTRPADFHLADGSSVQVDMMSQEAPLATYQSEEVQIAELAYGDSLYKMTILMPNDATTPITEFINQSLTSSNFNKWISELKAESIILNLPKFESAYKKSLVDILESMGMEEAFNQGADFTKINPAGGLQITGVLHKANITVNEEGSEAAAVTSVSIGLTSAGPEIRTINVNRPFVYLIRERISGTVLFMGVMKNPNADTD